MAAPLTLPAGAYDIVIVAAGCDTFSTTISNAPVRVEASTAVTRPSPIRLSCS